MYSPRPALALLASLVFAGVTHAAELKVDLNRSGYDSTTTATGYTAWGLPATTGTAATSRTFSTADGDISVSFAMAATSPNGTGLTTNWNKQYAQTTADTNGSKMVSDGVFVNGGDSGSQILMTITGLTAGNHSLLTYHNVWDRGWTSVGPMDVTLALNGTAVPGAAVTGLQPTYYGISLYTVPVAYLEFDITSTADVVTVLFDAATPAGSATRKNPVLCGFELDTGNLTRQAQSPSPADQDEHVDADTGSLTLSWAAAPAGQAISHNVYFGTSLATVSAATTASAEFKGNQTALSFALTGLDSLLTYYWRIDEVDASGNVTKGAVWSFRPRHLAFPGAEGYGRFARGGRGGRVVEVTSLADYLPAETPIPGTLRYAIEQETGPRTIVFTVSGLITLRSRLSLSSPYVTVAGQTAPGKGLCLRQYPFGLSGARDAIIRFLRVRPGKTLIDANGDGVAAETLTVDGMGMAGSNHAIIDHCSISWTIDEAFSSRSGRNITLQRTLISEALNAAGHQNYPAGTMHGYAASIGGDIGSFHHNLLAHCYGRNWSLAGGLDATNTFAGKLDLRNNVVYNWGHRATDGGAAQVDFVGNYYKPGAATDFFYALNATYEDTFAGAQQYYFAGNVMPGHFDESNQTAGRIATVSISPAPTYTYFVASPFFPSFITEQTAAAAYKSVLSDTGCTQPVLDDHDDRVLQETLDGTCSIEGSVTHLPGLPDSHTDVGGWENYGTATRAATWDSDHDGLPDWWEQIHGLNTASAAGDFSDANADPDHDGYTRLDDYLAWLAAPHRNCAPSAAIDLDLATLARGYTAAPTFNVTGATAGTVALLADGHTARFTAGPVAGTLGSFQFTVTDAAGDSRTATIGIRITTPVALTITRSGTDSVLNFRGISGQTYLLQHSTDLVGWTDWQAHDATGAAELITLPPELTAAPRRFFRATEAE